MSTYRNDTFGFAIDLPSGWGPTSGISHWRVFLANVINQANILEEFSSGNHELLNIVVERMEIEIPPDINELIFSLRAMKMRYANIQFGRITVGGREHAWASYVMNKTGWLKKYMIVLDGYGYALTASCPVEKKSRTMEAGWDQIVSSFRLLKPVSNSIISYNNLPQVKRTIEVMRQELKQQLEERQH